VERDHLAREEERRQGGARLVLWNNALFLREITPPYDNYINLFRDWYPSH
jgi:hypothetical protein